MHALAVLVSAAWFEHGVDWRLLTVKSVGKRGSCSHTFHKTYEIGAKVLYRFDKCGRQQLLFVVYHRCHKIFDWEKGRLDNECIYSRPCHCYCLLLVYVHHIFHKT